MAERGWRKRGASDTWQDTYQNGCFSPKIEIGVKPGKGDVRIALRNGERLFVESKKIKGGKKFLVHFSVVPRKAIRSFLICQILKIKIHKLF